MLESIGILILGLVVLVVGGELLVKGAVGLAIRFHVSTLVIGLTVVSFGTSAPELLVSINAALDGRSAIAIGNVVGSNIANLGLVLGITCMIYPITVARKTLRVDWSMMMLSSVLLFAFMLDGAIKWWEGLIMFIVLVVFNVWSVRRSRKSDVTEDFEIEKGTSLWMNIGLIVLGCIGLVFGSEWMVNGAVDIAEFMGVSDAIIGATVIAFGTSVPELATSVIAAIKKQTDISIGNLIGSNIFNILCILGITPMVKEIEFDRSVLGNEMVWMLVISMIILPLAVRSLKYDRWKGALLFLGYVAFCFTVIL